jgi:hypothetical protein
MKKFFYINLVASVLLIFSGISCSVKRGTMLKKRYSSGYTLMTAKKISGPEEANRIKSVPQQYGEPTETEVTVPATALAASDISAEMMLPLANRNKQNLLSFSVKTSHIKNTDKNHFSSISHPAYVKKNHSNAVASTHQKGKKGDDTELIVLVILSLFPILCLIAIYLKDGKNITLNFWIDLILHITLFGAIIFALLVVLDVVNLA